MPKERKLMAKHFDRARIEIRGVKERPFGIRFVSGEVVRYIELAHGGEMALASIFEEVLRKAEIRFSAFTESVNPEFEE